ncbi:carbon storage regulator [Vibrio maerlii]|uniref:carbon storage regulator n=1 Tax=Vibrio maerlii TaxID=2231648 RepID=UPI000E3DE09C|nr:carbon storage regulator [Vibrio maerlii]
MRTVLLTCCVLVTLSAYADDIEISHDELSNVLLESSRGGEYHLDIDNVVASSDIKGISAGNSVNNSVTGNNIIASGALMESSGITSVIQNSGNNVLIQNATVVNMSMK